MKIKALQCFAHAPSKRNFVINREYIVTDKSAEEFVRAGLAEEIAEPKHAEKKSAKE